MKPTTLALAALLLPLLSPVAPAQAPAPNWKTTLTTGNPPLRRYNPGTADASHMYVFGGFAGTSGTTPMNDLWRFDGTSWTLMTADGAPGSPPARAKACVAWNFGKNRLTVFGGADGSGGFFGDTWEWDPNTNLWTDVTPTGASPSARRSSSLTQDYATGQLLLFGGEDATGDRNDTWLFSGSVWTEVNLGGTLPKARHEHTVQGRSDMGDTILTQGYAYSGGYQKDTFVWNGLTWNSVNTGFVPSASVELDGAYDSYRRRVVLPGGGPGPVGHIAEIASEDNKIDMHFTDPGIGDCSQYFLAYLPTTKKIYKFGGLSSDATKPGDWTYEYQTDAYASMTVAGTGCAGVAGVPAIQPVGLPWLGGTLSAKLTNVDPTEIAVLLVGFSDTTWLGLSLPLDMGGLLGAPGCNLYLAPDSSFMAVLGAGPIPNQFNAPLPKDQAFAGVNVFLQGVTWDLASGFATSDYLTATLGLK